MMAKLNITKPDDVVRRLSSAQLKNIQQVYKASYKRIDKLISKQNLGTFSGQKQKEILEDLKEKIWKEQEIVSKQIEQLLKTGIYDTALEAVEVSKEWMKSFGIEAEGAYSYVPAEIVKAIVSGQVYDKKWYLSKAIWMDLKRTQSDIEQIISQGLSMNMTTFDIAKDLEKYVNPSVKKDYDWSKTYPGVRKKVDYNALRLAKTLTSHAYQQTYQRTVSKNPFVKGVKWNIANNHKVCDVCKERATQNKYGLGKGIYPKDKVPMDHPNGQCVLTSVTVSSVEVADRLARWAKGGNDKAVDKWMDDMFENEKQKEKAKTKLRKK